MLTRQQKETIVAEIAEVLGRDPSILFVDYRGVDTKEMRSLRSRIRKEGGVLRILRKTLFRRALSQAGLPEPAKEHLEGQLGIVYGFSDPVGVAKALRAFRKELESRTPHVRFGMRGGILATQLLGAKETEALAMLPTRHELLAKLVGSLAQPMTRLVGTLQNPVQSFVYILHAKSNQVVQL